MTVDGINPTIGSTEGAENGKEEQIINRSRLYKAFRRKVAVVSFQGKDPDSRASFVIGNDRQGAWQMYMLKVSQGLVTCT